MDTKRDSELKVHKGTPPRRVDYLPLALFGIIALILVVVVLVFAGLIEGLNQGMDRVTARVTSGVIVAVLVSAVQLWILRRNVRPEKRLAFVGAGGVGGAAGGLLAGLLVAGAGGPAGFLAGFLMGAAGGAVSSAIQIRIMRDRTLAQRWFWYSLGGWSVIWGLGVCLSWVVTGVGGVAVGGGLIVAASGLALWLLVQNAQIEF